jgi:hypothetical protein
MSRYAIGAAFIVLLFASAGSAQQAQGRGQTPAPAEKPPAAQGRTPPPAESNPPGQPVNVKLDITITDQGGSGEPARKTVSMLVADRAAGSIRSIANSVRAMLNVDATPQILPNGTIKVLLGLEYNPQRGDGPPTGSSLNQRVSVVLVPGKPMVLSQAADPLSDRRISVEIRGDILK